MLPKENSPCKEWLQGEKKDYFFSPLKIAPAINPRILAPAAVATFSFLKASLAIFLPISMPFLRPCYSPAPYALLPIM